MRDEATAVEVRTHIRLLHGMSKYPQLIVVGQFFAGAIDSPVNFSAERSALSSPGVIRRKPVGEWAKPLRGASAALFSIAIVIPL